MLERSRMKTLAAVCVLLFVVLLARLWYLQIALGGSLFAESEMNRTRLVRVRAPRGLIRDRKGFVLATSRPQFVVLATPETIEKDPAGLQTLSSILGMTTEELRKVMTHDRTAELAPVRVAIDVPLDVVAKLMERRAVLPGVSVELDQLRSYPDGQLAAHVLGYIGEVSPKELEAFRKAGVGYKPGDYVGKSGIEKQYEALLHGVDGGQRLEVDAWGRTRRVLGNQEPKAGSTLTVTIDRDLQIAAERSMEGKTGAAVALNPQTGEILAMVSKPDFDPNIFVKKVRREDWTNILSNTARPMQNRAVANKYPPGSTFKQVTATAALEYKVATPNTGFYCPGAYRLGRTFHCWKRHGHVNFTTAISQSCDVFFYEMGRRVGINNLAKMARGFGLGQATMIDLPDERRRPGDLRKGTVPDEEWKWQRYHEKWYPGETLPCAIGQGYVETTPLQMALVAAAISMSGRMYRPHVLLEVRDPEGKVVERIKPQPERKVPASAETFKAVQWGMRQTVVGPGGTGRVVDIDGVTVAAKTGSAEMGPGRRPHAWFVCYARVEKPEIAIAVIAEHGGHGATAAAPVARAILDVYYGKKKASDIQPGVARVQGD